MGLQLISVSPGMTWDPGAEWTRPIGASELAEEHEAPAEGATQEATRLRRRAQVRRRARTDRGTFQPDDPTTPEADEAYEAEPEPGKLQQ